MVAGDGDGSGELGLVGEGESNDALTAGLGLRGSISELGVAAGEGVGEPEGEALGEKASLTICRG